MEEEFLPPVVLPDSLLEPYQKTVEDMYVGQEAYITYVWISLDAANIMFVRKNVKIEMSSDVLSIDVKITRVVGGVEIDLLDIDKKFKPSPLTIMAIESNPEDYLPVVRLLRNGKLIEGEAEKEEIKSLISTVFTSTPSSGVFIVGEAGPISKEDYDAQKSNKWPKALKIFHFNCWSHFGWLLSLALFLSSLAWLFSGGETHDEFFYQAFHFSLVGLVVVGIFNSIAIEMKGIKK